VRVILLAESHVRTNELETKRRVDLTSLGGPDVPKPFVRLVYCLGYGENGLLDLPLDSNSGTPSYWRLLWSAVHDPDDPIAGNPPPLMKAHTELEERARNKIALLTELKSRGIWLLDASLVALYGHPAKPSPAVIRAAIEASWKLHVRRAVLEAKPAAIVVIGKTVFEILREHLRRMQPDELTWIYQPGAYVSHKKKLEDRISLHRICTRHVDDPAGVGVSSPRAALVDLLTHILSGEETGWVLFDGGTFVAYYGPIPDPVRHASELLDRLGKAVPGTPSADFDVHPIGNNWIVSYSHPAIFTFVSRAMAREQLGEKERFEEIEIGLLGRSVREWDTSSKMAVHVEKPLQRART
jgi:hypothetical protein